VHCRCKRFYEYCKEHAIELRHANCTIAYDTNVPRQVGFAPPLPLTYALTYLLTHSLACLLTQVGLAGSSAIITATVRALLAFHHITAAQLPLDELPTLVLSIETNELGINAGLQDRVIQAYPAAAAPTPEGPSPLLSSSPALVREDVAGTAASSSWILSAPTSRRPAAASTSSHTAQAHAHAAHATSPPHQPCPLSTAQVRAATA
jgi:hypothetical protein